MAGNTTGLAHTESPKQSERDVKCISLKPTSCGRWWWAVGCKFTRFTDTDKTSQLEFFLKILEERVKNVFNFLNFEVELKLKMAMIPCLPLLLKLDNSHGTAT